MFKVIIFDLDGTLIETQHICNEAIRLAFMECGHVITDEEILSIAGIHPSDFIPKLLESREHKASEVDELTTSFKKFFHELWDSWVTLRGDVKSLCQKLTEKGFKLGLVTTSSKSTVDKFIGKFELEDVFNIIVTSNDVTETKPHPEPYLLAIEKFAYPKEEILVVEDSRPGLLSAKSAGLKVAIIPSKYTSHQDFSSMDYSLKTLDDVLNLVN